MRLRFLWHVPRGMLMGSADIVPGVSGGTIALILNIYPRLVQSVRAGSTAAGSLLRGDRAAFGRWLSQIEWSFLLPLGAGILLAAFSLAHTIETALERYPIEMAALFLGLVSGSCVIAWRLLTRHDLRHVLVAALVGAVTFAALGLSAGAAELTEPPLVAFFAAGAVAVCAMILPGISGSFLLVMLGMYAPVLAAVADADPVRLGVFALGAAVGLGLFSQVLHWALERFYDALVAGLIGLMIGSVRVLWPWPVGVEITVLAAPTVAAGQAALLAVAGFALVLAVTWASEHVQRIEAADEVAELKA